MLDSDRRIQESPLYQGADEQVIYKLTTTPWGSSPTSTAVVVKDEDGTDVTSTTTTGSTSVSGDVITLPTVHSLTADKQYRVEVKFTVGGNIMEAWADLIGQV